MSVPVIDIITGWLAWPLGQNYEYQLNATNVPTSWSVSGAPSGLSITSAGVLHGVATVPGTYNVRATATNGTGDSAEMLFTIGVEDADDALSMAIPLDMDLDSGEVTSPRLAAGAGAEAMPFLRLKPGDRVMLALAIKRGDIFLTPAVSGIRIGIKYDDAEALNSESDVVPVAVGSTVTRRWQFPFTVDNVPTGGADISESLDDNEAATPGTATFIDALCEFEVSWIDDVDFDGTTEDYKRTSLGLKIRIERELVKG